MEKQKVTCEVCKGEFINIGSHMKAHAGLPVQPSTQVPPTTTTTPTPETTTPTPQTTTLAPQTVAPVPPTTTYTLPNQAKLVVLMNTSGMEVPKEDYFFKGVMQPGFTNMCGKAVDREDLMAVFNRVFKPSDNFLFYKLMDKEVYIIIVPIRYSTTIGEAQNSLDGDFQKHAISFISEGSVNLDTLKMKLDRIVKFCKFSDR